MKKAVLSILLMIAICFNASPCVGFAEEDAIAMEESIQESAGHDAPAHAEPRQESAPIVEATPVESSEEEEFEAIDESQGYGQLSSDDVIIRDYEDEIGSAGEGSEDQEEDAWFFSEQAGTLSRDNDDVYSTEDYSDSEPTTGQIVGMSTGNSLVVGMENPGRVTPGKSLSIHSVVSGGSGNYSYEWNWTHPNGGELKDFRQNCIIYGSVLGTYTFTLTVTDNETGESVTSGKLVVEVKPTNSEYDPMQIHFIGDEDEVEIELAMAGIAAKCDVSGGSGNFEYAWDIFRDGVNLNSYYYGLVEETCTWNVDKVGIYTFQVAVKDRETGLVAVASHSISVVQKEFDPLTVAIISAPAYAKIGEEVFVIAETNGGVGNVLVSWEVYDEKTCVANGDGTKVHFIPTSDEKYTVIVRATDRAQTLEDRVTITAGNLVKCALSASADSMKTGEEINAQVSVRDGIGPFKYEWMLYLNDQFMSSDLNSSSTIYTWTAEQAGTYRITCTVYDLGKEEAEGKLVWATDSVEVVVTSAEQPITVAAPSVTLTVDGIKMTATWPAVEGASRYVYSLRNMATNTNSIDHEDAGSCSITQYLEAGISYRLAVAAVPAGVNDMVNPERCSWTEKEFSIAEISRLDVPDVTLTIDGKTVMATWPAVAGAGRYVYSLRNVTTDEVSIFHEKADSRTITKDLEAGISYKLAVAAVPVGVDDVANPEKCSWTEKSFAIDSEEELNTAKVLSVTCDDAVLQPGESKSMTITCNSATTLLDVYKELPDGTMLDYTTLNNGGAAYSYSVSFAENGKYRLRFVALNHLNDWSRDSANWGYADIIVCDHSTKVEQVSKTNPKYVNSNEHAVTINYREACVCGQVNREYAEEVVEAHTYSTNDIHVEEKHYDGLGHKEFYVCSVCKGSIETGNYRGYKNNTFSYCSVCVQLRLKNYWKLYNGAIDGVCGSGTIGAANKFRNKCGLGNIETLDDDTCKMIITMSSYPAPISTIVPEEAESNSINEYETFVQNGTALKYLDQLDSMKDSSAYQVTSNIVLDDYGNGGFDVWIDALYKAATSEGAVEESEDFLTQDDELLLMKELVLTMVNASVVHEDTLSSDILNSVFDVIDNVGSYTDVISEPVAQCLRMIGYNPIDAANTAAEMVGTDGVPFSKIDFSTKGNLEVSSLNYGLTALSTIMGCCNIRNVSLEQKEALILAVLEYDANMQALERIKNASTGTLKTATEQVQKELEDAYIGQFNKIQQDATTGLLTLGGNTIVNVFDMGAPIRGIYRLITNQTSKMVDARFAFIEYSRVISNIHTDCYSAVVNNGEAAYDLLQLYCIGLKSGYDNTYQYYESYGKTWKGRISTAFGKYDSDEILSIISEQKMKVEQLQRDMIEDIR